MSRNASHYGTSPHDALHQSCMRDGQNDGGHSPTYPAGGFTGAIRAPLERVGKASARLRDWCD